MHVVDVTLENLEDCPAEVLSSVFWEVEQEEPPVEAGFLKEEWFSSTLLEWGACGKLLIDDDVVGFTQYGPPSFFPGLSRFRCGRVSGDAVYLSYCYIVPKRRGRGGGSHLIKTVASDLNDRGFRALEAIGDREWEGDCVLPAGFLASSGFEVIREDQRFPLMRLTLGTRTEPAVQAGAVSLPEL